MAVAKKLNVVAVVGANALLTYVEAYTTLRVESVYCCCFLFLHKSILHHVRLSLG